MAAVCRPLDVKARDFGLAVAPGAYAHLLPGVAGFVGGDHVSVVLATGLDDYPGVALGVDIGTNTEIALAKGGTLTCCSCASGPAFEGGQIARGMRAVAGAIDRVWREGDEVRYRVIGGGQPLGFSGSGSIDLLAALLRTGAVDETGRLRPGHPGVIESDGGPEFLVGGVPFSQGDIRQLQLAKAAIRSGVEALLAAMGVSPAEIERVYLAGAFGMALDPASAMDIGIFPRLPEKRFTGVGNAAGIGACLCLASVAERRRAAAIAAKLRYLELTAVPGYQDLFLRSLGLPAKAAGSR